AWKSRAGVGLRGARRIGPLPHFFAKGGAALARGSHMSHIQISTTRNQRGVHHRLTPPSPPAPRPPPPPPPPRNPETPRSGTGSPPAPRSAMGRRRSGRGG